MFSYVAKTLLSKTLRTFLRTYLDDIELEGINWNNDTTTTANNNKNNNSGGSGSGGWDIQLSNVKLREGMELVKLPGKRRRTVIVTKRVKKKEQRDNNNINNRNATTTDEDDMVDQTPRISNRKQKLSLERKDEPFDMNAVELPLNNNQSITQSAIEKDEDIHQHDAKNATATLDESTIQRFFSDDYTDPGYFSSNPPTPKQTRTGFCGLPMKSVICNTNDDNNHNEGKKKKSSSHLAKIQKYSTDYKNAENQDYDQEIRSHDGSRSVSFDESSIDNNRLERSEYKIAPPPDLRPPHLIDFAPGGITNNEDDDESSYIEVEEECIVEDDMALVVGAGGVIGTLNIRVVDKELHITVEDAHLILEVVPKENVNSSENGNVNVSSSNSPTKAVKQPKTVERSSSSSTNVSEKKMNEESATIGGKVKQKSVFAKLLSMIPMLFLRDCRVTLILPEEEVDSSREDDSNHNDDESSNNVDEGDNCTVFEVGIDFLSVASGDDFMDVFKRNTVDTPPHKKAGRDKPEIEARCGQHSNYVYERRLLRTGKGPEGGIWLKIHRPSSSDIVYGRKKRPNYNPSDEQRWARRRFLDSSQAFCFRCSGIDLHARIVLEKRKPVDEEVKNILSDEFEDYTIDSMLFGVDYIDGAALTRHANNKQRKLLEQKTQMIDNLEASESNIDTNGIEIIPMSSNFHWLAQNCHRTGCITSHIPLGECVNCWNTCIDRPESTSPHSSMDDSMPLPGSVFCLSITDPIEMNVDRNHLDAFGYMLSLFTAKSTKVESNSSQVKQQKAPKRDDVVPLQDHPAIARNIKSNAFPSYMKPDAIFISDIYVAKITVRIHALRPKPENDLGLRFGFWELNASSICCEDQQVDCDEMQLRDMIFHVGSLRCIDYKGTCDRRIAEFGPVSGIPPRPRNHSQNDVYIPFTAPRLLELPPPAAFDDVGTSTMYALHSRVILRGGPKGGKFVSFKTGTFCVDMDRSFVDSLSAALSEAKLIIIGKEEREPTKQSENKSEASTKKDKPLWLIQAATKGGSLSYQPLVKVKLPASRYQAKTSSVDGFSLNTFLNGLGVEYGKSLVELPAPTSLVPLSALPESLRLHVLLYLDDLTPLEKALKIKKKKKKSTSAFLRSHAVSKKLATLQPTFNKHASTEEETHHRNDLLSRLQSLDVESLEALLAIHDSFPKKTKG